MSSYADFPEVDKVDPTDENGYGSDTLSELFKILNGKILDSRRPHILNPWMFEGPITIKQQPTTIDPAVYTLASGQALLYLDSVTNRLTIKKFGGTTADLETSILLLQDLTNVTITSVQNNDALRYNSTTGTWNNVAVSGTGEANTASNVGTSGIGIYKQKTGINLELKKVDIASSKVSITDDTVNSKVNFDVVESNLNHANIGGTLGVSKGGTGATTLTGILRGNGTSAFTGIGLGNNGDILTNVSGTPSFQPPSTTVTGVEKLPDQPGGVVGRMFGGRTATPIADGILKEGVTSGTLSTERIAGEGNFTIFTTAATDAAIAEYKNLAIPTERAFNPRFKIRFKKGQYTQSRLIIGFSDDTTLGTGASQETNQFNSNSGFALYLRRVSTGANDTNFQILRNDGSATRPALIDTGVGFGTATTIHTFELVYDNANARIGWSLDGSAISYVTTSIPAANTTQNLFITNETNSTNATDFRINWAFVTQDK